MNLIPAVAVGLAGVACLFGAWRRGLPARWAPVPLGWGLLLASGWLWATGAGPEFGSVLALLVTALIAWGFVAGNRSQRPRRAAAAEGPPKPNAEARAWLHHALLFLLAVPIAAVTTALVAVAVSLALPVAAVDAMVVVIIVMPVLWGAAAYWVCADTRLLRPALTLLVGALAGAAVVYA